MGIESIIKISSALQSMEKLAKVNTALNALNAVNTVARIGTVMKSIEGLSRVTATADKFLKSEAMFTSLAKADLTTAVRFDSGTQTMHVGDRQLKVADGVLHFEGELSAVKGSAIASAKLPGALGSMLKTEGVIGQRTEAAADRT
jgi:hypothetical protein